jgi:hypothetical protein
MMMQNAEDAEVQRTVRSAITNRAEMVDVDNSSLQVTSTTVREITAINLTPSPPNIEDCRP